MPRAVSVFPYVTDDRGSQDQERNYVIEPLVELLHLLRIAIIIPELQRMKDVTGVTRRRAQQTTTRGCYKRKRYKTDLASQVQPSISFTNGSLAYNRFYYTYAIMHIRDASYVCNRSQSRDHDRLTLPICKLKKIF